MSTTTEPTSANTTPAPPRATLAPREYIVFQPASEQADCVEWTIVWSGKAVTPEDALEQAATTLDGEPGTLTAVAARNWQPRTPEVEPPPPPKRTWK